MPLFWLMTYTCFYFNHSVTTGGAHQLTKVILTESIISSFRRAVEFPAVCNLMRYFSNDPEKGFDHSCSLSLEKKSLLRLDSSIALGVTVS